MTTICGGTGCHFILAIWTGKVKITYKVAIRKRDTPTWSEYGAKVGGAFKLNGMSAHLIV